MTNEKRKKNEKNYYCEICDFDTSKKTDYTRHILTDKHRRLIMTNKKTNKTTKKTTNIIDTDNKYACNCGKSYCHLSSLYKHKKLCTNVETEIETNQGDTNLLMQLIKQHSEKETSGKELILQLIIQLTKQNSELIEVVKNGTHNNNSHNTNSLNKTFNLQFFLNETCKDAINIMDFIDSIKLQLSDLENVAKVGYVEGISNIITTNLKALDVTLRPVHCTDNKRETIYIKDDNKWEKEDDNKVKLRKAIKRVATKNQRLILKYKEVHPDCGKASSKFSDQYNKIIVESMGGSGDNDLEKEDKIIRKIAVATTIDKITHVKQM